MKIRSFAKINLGLELVGRRPDGYHDILTLFQTISLFDELDFSPRDDRGVILEGDDPSVPWDEGNLIHRAARLLQERSHSAGGVAIRVAKHVPAGRGLAGGSSNAAVTLHVLNRMWNLGFGLGQLEEMGRTLGADVPYFLHGGLCLGEQRGDILSELPDLEPLFCLLAFPPFPIRTASIYGGVDPSLTSADKVSKIMRFLETRDFGLLENDLERVILREHPELEEFKRFIKNQGAVLCLVSGSGSAVFGLFNDRERARTGLEKLEEWSDALLVEILPRERYWTGLDAGV